MDKKVHDSSESNESSSSEDDSFMKELNRHQKQSNEAFEYMGDRLIIHWKLYLKVSNWTTTKRSVKK